MSRSQNIARRTQTPGRRSAAMRLRVVIMELKGLMPFITALSMDDETRHDVEVTLINCRDRLDLVAQAFKPAPRPRETNNSVDKET